MLCLPIFLEDRLADLLLLSICGIGQHGLPSTHHKIALHPSLPLNTLEVAKSINLMSTQTCNVVLHWPIYFNLLKFFKAFLLF